MDYGGIGIKHVGIFNRALLTKGLWRFLKETNAIWCGILEFRYGNLVRKILGKDVCSVIMVEGFNGVGEFLEETGFNNQCKLGVGIVIPFWTSRWIGSSNFKSLYPSLYEAYDR